MILFDLDDYAPSHDESCLDWLVELKRNSPDLKVTLFTIPGRWPINLLRNISVGFSDWIEFAVHGFMHEKNEEVLRWGKQKWFEVLNLCEATNTFVKIFKAPNWQMSRLGYQVLKELGWAVAVRQTQIDEVPKGMKYYSFEEQNGVHGHTWLMSSHEKNGVFKDWNKESKFDFISKNLKVR